jgi:hypothetical protein
LADRRRAEQLTMPAWVGLAKVFLATPAGKGVLWVLDKIGLKKVIEIALVAVERGVKRIGYRRKAIAKARHTIDGRWAPVVVDDRTRWVVYSGAKPVEIFPAITGDLVEAMETFNTERLRHPDDVSTTRFVAWARNRLRHLGKDDEAEDAAGGSSPEGEAIRDALARIGEQGGQALFHAMVDKLPALLDQLSASDAETVASHAGIPEKPGVYLFSEGVTPVYLGQTRNLRQRLRQHTSTSSRESQAALAWQIALTDAKEAGHPVSGTRKELEADEEFAAQFRNAKVRVAAMSVRFIELDDPVTRTIFEVYAARALGTDEFNSWETH